MSEMLLRAEALCRYYRRGQHEIRAVDQVDLQIARGEFLAVVGASGSGKSTLLNLLAGLDTPTAGTIHFGELRLDKLSRRELARYRAERVGMVFQTFNLLPQHTALRNVEIALAFHNQLVSRRRALAAEMLERVGLADRMHHRPADMSGGEQQRVAIARAVVKRPDLIFADEPTGNLDHDNAAQIAGLLTELNRDGLTIVMVTHALDLARQLAQRQLRMNYGRFVATADSAVES